MGLVLIAVAFITSLYIKDQHEVRNCKTVAITQIVEHPALDATRKGILDELEAHRYIVGENLNLIFDSAQGDIVVANQIAQRFSGIKPNAIVALGTPAAQAIVSEFQGKDTPIIFASVTDPLSSRLVADIKKPEGNITGLSNWVEVTPQLEVFQKIVPNLKKLGVIYNLSETNSVSMLKEIEKSADTLGIEVIHVPANNTSEVSTAAYRLVREVDAIFISNDNTALSAFESIVKIATMNEVPVFVSDTDMLDRGAAAALGPNQYKLGRQAGKMLIRVLEGTAPSQIPVEFPSKTELHLNLKALASIRLAVPEDVMKEAKRILSASSDKDEDSES